MSAIVDGAGHTEPYQNIDKALTVLLERGDATYRCTQSEIATVASQVDRRLPESYTYFLKVMGRGAGSLWRGTHVFFPTMLGLTEIGRELVSEDANNLHFGENTFVFAMHQGYSFMFFCLDESDDPAVWYYLEQSGTYSRQSQSFSKYVLECALAVG